MRLAVRMSDSGFLLKSTLSVRTEQAKVKHYLLMTGCY